MALSSSTWWLACELLQLSQRLVHAQLVKAIIPRQFTAEIEGVCQPQKQLGQLLDIGILRVVVGARTLDLCRLVHQRLDAGLGNVLEMRVEVAVKVVQLPGSFEIFSADSPSDIMKSCCTGSVSPPRAGFGVPSKCRFAISLDLEGIALPGNSVSHSKLNHTDA